MNNGERSKDLKIIPRRIAKAKGFLKPALISTAYLDGNKKDKNISRKNKLPVLNIYFEKKFFIKQLLRLR